MKLTKPMRDVLRVRRLVEGDGRFRLAIVPEEWVKAFADLPERGGRITHVSVAASVIHQATMQLNKPYNRRALIRDAPNEFSCSSLTRWLYRKFGIDLPRYAIEQSYFGTPVVDLEALQKGDLVFMRNRFPAKDVNREIGHVAIVTGEETILDASEENGGVAVRSLPREELVFAARVIPAEPQVLLHVPKGAPDLDTAETVATWLQRGL